MKVRTKIGLHKSTFELEKEVEEEKEQLNKQKTQRMENGRKDTE